MLLSPDYKKILTLAHEKNPHWGPGRPTWAGEIAHFATCEGAKSLIDYGCGKGGMVEHMRGMGFPVQGYDPGVAAFQSLPRRADLVYCLDVLEHIEPDCLGSVLEHIAQLAPLGFFVISMKRAKEILPDGRNAHLIVEGAEYWTASLGEFYRHVAARTGRKTHELVVTCTPTRPGE